MTTLLIISTPLFIVIIVFLVLIIAFLLWVLRVVLRQNDNVVISTETLGGWTDEDMLNFAQALTNHEVVKDDLYEWSELNAECGDCGHTLTLVRPGSHQCDNAKCSSNVRFSDN